MILSKEKQSLNRRGMRRFSCRLAKWGAETPFELRTKQVLRNFVPAGTRQ
jgi:hypothetical protein